VAAALPAQVLALLSDVPGLVLDGAVVAGIPVGRVPELLGREQVRDGMIPKLEAARRAVEGGTGRAWIAAWQGPGTLDALGNGSARGTTVHAAPAESARV
jgi:acetylglutamate kinase